MAMYSITGFFISVHVVENHELRSPLPSDLEQLAR
jgi:hypothetical protein